MFRDDAVFNLLLCPSCGQQQIDVAPDAEAYRRAFIARGQVPEGHRGTWKFKETTSTCATCLALIRADVVIRDDKVYFDKVCDACGPSSALVAEDATYYVNAYNFSRAGTEPFSFGTDVAEGCPTDCGTCGDHEQHTCLPIIEVTDHCNLECPVCIVENQYSTHMAPEVFGRIIDDLVSKEGYCESVALSGGEPTSHPQILELIDIATRPEIGRVVLITNGLRLGQDREFAQALKDKNAYIGLQLDGFDARTHEAMRGRDLTEQKAAALETIRALHLPTQMIFVATHGVNDDQVGRAVQLFLEEDDMLSLNFQPVSYSGLGGGKFAHDPNDRLTISGLIQRLIEQSDGLFRDGDFTPLPCSHPQCVSLSYLLKLDDGSYIPFARFADFTRHGDLLRSSATLPASDEIHDVMHEIIHDVFAREDEVDRGSEILAALRRSLEVMFPDRPLTPVEATRIGEGQAKSIFIHHYMDRHDFDLERLRKCCHHYPQADGKVMPACGYNLFHRGAAKGEGTAVPSWAMNAPSGAGTAGARLKVIDG